ncbi:hypothetical protein VFPFJ_06846 [Purpureocillium lilacinum]|uniref:Uncharacterized protein n=1 Tax=Purpureocillium lilacinum TaxID=33203 RepID=A0A179HFN4_PURLI|nr:hypothetical protein VFPFJ_06846 [Purpureocillium lilacinum]OAQ88381.1 hypothetical protein VFPFJ_06846 [Purpureocillium lilacinum]
MMMRRHTTPARARTVCEYPVPYHTALCHVTRTGEMKCAIRLLPFVCRPRERTTVTGGPAAAAGSMGDGDDGDGGRWTVKEAGWTGGRDGNMTVRNMGMAGRHWIGGVRWWMCIWHCRTSFSGSGTGAETKKLA